MRCELFRVATVIVSGLAGVVSVRVAGWTGILVATVLFFVGFRLLDAAICAAREGAK